MRNLAGPLHPWLGLVDAFGAGLALVLWLWVRGLGDRARTVVAAGGAALLAVAVASAMGRASAIWSIVAQEGFHNEPGRRWLDIVLVLGGTAAGIAAALAVRRRVVGDVTPVHLADVDDAYDLLLDRVPAEVIGDAPAYDASALDDADDDALDDAGPADPDDDLADDPDGVGWVLAPWLDLLLVALAIAVPSVFFGFSGAFDSLYGTRGDVTALVVCVHLLTGLLTAGALWVAARTDDTDERVPALAFVLVAVGSGLTWAWPQTFANEVWSMLAAGLVLGLLAVAALPLLARVVTADRAAIAYGVVGAVALVALAGVVSARASAERYDSGNFDFGSEVGDDTVVPADPPSPVFVPPEESFGVPPLPTFPPFPTGP
jgi:hypothetical protein